MDKKKYLAPALITLGITAERTLLSGSITSATLDDYSINVDNTETDDDLRVKSNIWDDMWE